MLHFVPFGAGVWCWCRCFFFCFALLCFAHAWGTEAGGRALEAIPYIVPTYVLTYFLRHGFEGLQKQIWLTFMAMPGPGLHFQWLSFCWPLHPSIRPAAQSRAQVPSVSSRKEKKRYERPDKHSYARRRRMPISIYVGSQKKKPRPIPSRKQSSKKKKKKKKKREYGSRIEPSTCYILTLRPFSSRTPRSSASRHWKPCPRSPRCRPRTGIRATKP